MHLQNSLISASAALHMQHAEVGGDTDAPCTCGAAPADSIAVVFACFGAATGPSSSAQKSAVLRQAADHLLDECTALAMNGMALLLASIHAILVLCGGKSVRSAVVQHDIPNATWIRKSKRK